MHPSRAYKIEEMCKDLSVLSRKIDREIPEIRTKVDTYRPKPAPSDCFVHESAGSVSALRTELAVARYRIRDLENKVTFMELCQDERISRVYLETSTQTPLAAEFAVSQTTEKLTCLERELAALLQATSSLVRNKATNN